MCVPRTEVCVREREREKGVEREGETEGGERGYFERGKKILFKLRSSAVGA